MLLLDFKFANVVGFGLGELVPVDPDASLVVDEVCPDFEHLFGAARGCVHVGERTLLVKVATRLESVRNAVVSLPDVLLL